MTQQSMRGLIQLVEAIYPAQEVDESGAGPSRIIQHIHNGAVFIMLSAMRHDMKHAENLRRTEKLKKMLTQLPVSFIATEGEYTEEGTAQPFPEKSFFIVPRRGAQTTDPETFKAFGVKLMHAFQQDSILFGDGHMATLIFSDGGTFDLGDTATFRPEVIDKLEGFSKIHNRKFSFTSAEKAAAPIQKSDVTEPARTKGVTYSGNRMVA